jgi:agmatine deiminase
VITDAQTNKLFLADCLPIKFPDFFSALKQLLNELKVDFQLLSNTNDIWAVDYMPIQIDHNEFVQFIYRPDYLRGKIWRNTISDGAQIAHALGIKSRTSDIILDGGNVVRGSNKAVLCDKIVKENVSYSREKLLTILMSTLKVDKLFLIPQQPGDFIGHADGMIRFVDDNTVLVNDFSKEKPAYQKLLKTALLKMGLDYITMPYNPYNNRTNTHANGIYINYLQMEKLIVLPIFGLKEDEHAVKLMETLFSGYTIATIDSNEIANHGGVLNCISWNIYQQ